MTTEPRLDDPVIFRSDVSEEGTNLTRYEYPRVSSSPESLHIQFAILGTINILVAISCGLLIVAILRSPKLRNRPFDLYILCIAIPDFWSGISCMFVCLLSVPNSTYISENWCGYQSFFLNASVAANTWMNAVIVYQIHKLLRFSHTRRRYFPPTKKQVCCHVGCVYTYSILWGAVCAIQKVLPSHAYGGFYCIPMEQEGNSWFFYLIFLNGVFVMPAIYATGALTHILWNGLLPKTGRRRQLAIFMIRIIFLYFVVFLPVAISVLIGNFVFFGTDWGYYVPAVMTHLQGILTTSLCYWTNKDYSDSMDKVLRCDWKSGTDEDANDRSNEYGGLPNRSLSSRRFFSWTTRLGNSSNQQQQHPRRSTTLPEMGDDSAYSNNDMASSETPLKSLQAKEDIEGESI